jgi:uncharacterized protein (UPF0147 family)
MEFIEEFAIEKLGVVENNIATMMDKHYILESRLRRDDESIEDVQKTTNHVCDLCKLAGASDMKTKKNPLEKIEEDKIELEKRKKEEESRQVEEIKVLDDIPNDPLASLENCTLDEIISILQNQACDPLVDSNQVGFGTFIANHVIK